MLPTAEEPSSTGSRRPRPEGALVTFATVTSLRFLCRPTHSTPHDLVGPGGVEPPELQSP